MIGPLLRRLLFAEDAAAANRLPFLGVLRRGGVRDVLCAIEIRATSGLRRPRSWSESSSSEVSSSALVCLPLLGDTSFSGSFDLFGFIAGSGG